MRSGPGQRENIVLLERSYYQASASDFIAREDEAILGELVASHTFDTDVLQRGAWQHQIKTIKRILPSLPSSDVLFEFVRLHVPGWNDFLIAGR